MHKGATAQIFDFARINREKPTKEEEILWTVIKDRKIEGQKFRRQHPIGRFILDFYCHALKLGIEIDGGYHQGFMQKEYDKERTDLLETEEITVIRFENQDITDNIEDVTNSIKDCILSLVLVQTKK
jgi:very-short-patch-repair endonuclease